MKTKKVTVRLTISAVFALILLFIIATANGNLFEENRYLKRTKEIELLHKKQESFPYFLFPHMSNMRQSINTPEHTDWKKGIYYIVKEDGVELLYVNKRKPPRILKDIKDLNVFLTDEYIKDSLEFYFVPAKKLDSTDYKKCYSVMEKIDRKKGLFVYLASYKYHSKMAYDSALVEGIKVKQVDFMDSGKTPGQSFVLAAEQTILSCPDFAIALDSFASVHMLPNERTERLFNSVKRLSKSIAFPCNKENMIDILIMMSMPETSFSVQELKAGTAYWASTKEKVDVFGSNLDKALEGL